MLVLVVLVVVDKFLMCVMQRKVIILLYSLYGYQDVRDIECFGYMLYNVIWKWIYYNVIIGKLIEIRISVYCIYGYG